MHCLLILRNDLRLHDHPGFQLACRSTKLSVIYFLDPSLRVKTSWGFERSGAHRLRFIKESLIDLHNSLKKMNQAVQVFETEPIRTLDQILQTHHIQHVIWQSEDTPEEKSIEEAWRRLCVTKGVLFSEYRAQSLFDPKEVSSLFSRMPQVFTEFRKKLEKSLQPPDPIPKPAHLPKFELILSSIYPEKWTSEIDALSVTRFKGGEKSGLARLKEYLWDKDLLKSYKLSRNQMLGDDYSSKFSPWLALGCLSARLVYHEIKRYEVERIQNESTYWLFFELMWRDFFRFTAAEAGNRFFHPSGLSTKKQPVVLNEEIFQAWISSLTGVPVIDACMKELDETGFMSNRGRQLVASFFVKDLKQPWWVGAAWFEHHLVDYDPCSNYGNWLYIAGLGNDPRENRYFNQIHQAERYDPEGVFVKKYLPFLEKVPAFLIHRPHRWVSSGFNQYTKPLVDSSIWE